MDKYTSPPDRSNHDVARSVHQAKNFLSWLMMTAACLLLGICLWLTSGVYAVSAIGALLSITSLIFLFATFRYGLDCMREWRRGDD